VATTVVLKYWSRVQNWLTDEIRRHLAVFNVNLLAEVDSRRSDSAGLSLWLAANLPLNDQLKLQLLAMQSPVKRLRCELNFLAKVSLSYYYKLI